MNSQVFHPRMLRMLEKIYFPQRCALKKPVKSQDSTGAETSAYETQAGYASLPCRVAPATGGERRGSNYTHLDTTHTLLISGTYDDVTEEWVAVVDGVTYQILKPGNASRNAEGGLTRFEARFIR